MTRLPARLSVLPIYGNYKGEKEIVLVESIGQGGNSPCWLAEIGGRRVAAKELKRVRGRIDPSREYNTGAILSKVDPLHLNLPDGLIRTRDSNPRYFLLTPLISTKTLKQAMLEGDRIDPDAFEYDMRQALKEMHDAGYCHGDIKPSNIIISPQGGFFLIDFGCAVQLNIEKQESDFASLDSLIRKLRGNNDNDN